MRLALILLVMAQAAALAQEATSGFEMRGTGSALGLWTPELSEEPRDGAPVTAGAHLTLYPVWKIDDHWTLSGAVVFASRPYAYEDFGSTGHGLRFDVLQATLGYSKVWNNNSLVVRTGVMPSAFGSFLLRYDDAENPLIDVPLGYGYYDTGVTTQGLTGVETDLTVGRVDMRAQFVNSSPVNPYTILEAGQFGGWAAGAGYTIHQGLRVGASWYRGPYLGSDDTMGLEDARKYPASGYGLDLEWGRGPWNVNAELQRFQMTNGIVEPGVNQWVGYGEVRRTLSPRWYVAARVGSSRQQDASSNLQVWEGAVGFRPAARQLIKFDYEAVREPDEMYNVVAVQFVTQFRAFSFGHN